MSSLSHLRATIRSILSPHGPQHGEQEFFEELMAHQQDLLRMYDVGPRSQQEQHELETGGGRPLSVNANFVRQALFISQQLDCSERFVSGLLQGVIAENPNLSEEHCIEAAIVAFHRRRRDLADCMRYILEAAELGTSGGAAHDLYTRINVFVCEHLLPSIDAASMPPLPSRIFNQLLALSSELSNVQKARQNARSDTVAPSAQGTSGSLGVDILTLRCDSLKYERRTLATALYHLGRLGYIPPSELHTIIEWLMSNPPRPMTHYVLATVLAAFDLLDPDTFLGQVRQELINDQRFVEYMSKRLGPATQWKDPGLKATILLKWTLFLTDWRRRAPELENQEGFRADELETQIWNAVQGDCFTYLLRLVAQMQNKHSSYASTSFAANILAQPEPDSPVELPAGDFKPFLLEACEVLLRSLITQASSELRKIKQRQEDLLLAGTRGDRSRLFRSTHGHPGSRLSASQGPEPERPSAPPRNDTAVLFTLIGLLYSLLPPERALHFWGAGGVLEGRRTTYSEIVESNSGKLPMFLQWAVWSTQARDVDMLAALYDMLGGLAKGQQCSELAYNFLARGGGDVVPGSSLPSTSHLATAPAVSWNSIFGILDSWFVASAGTGSYPNQPAQSGAGVSQPGPYGTQSIQTQQAPQPTQQLTFTQKDVLLAQAFLRLLSTVANYSVIVRTTIAGHARFRAIQTLVSLIPLGIPLELKGSIFDTLSSFCQPGAGAAGIEICRSVWQLMERLEVINVRASSHIGGPLAAMKGVEVELEEVEAVYKMYPSTIPFLKLLSTLIHTPKSIPLQKRFAESEDINTIPESLGQPYRQPGIGPFSSFVIDDVFSKINAREYLRPTDRWRMNDLCLCFIERCLASYDLESLLTKVDELQPKGDEVVQLAIHPGYDIMQRLLTHSSLQSNILSYLLEGLDGFDRGLAEEEPFFRTTIVRVLRIIHRVFEIQDIFLDILLPSLADVQSLADIGEVHPASYFVRFDTALSYTPEHVPAVAAYVAYPRYPELNLLSVKILTLLAASTSLSQLPLLIDKSAESARILDGYQTIMDMDVLEDVEETELIAEQNTGAGAPDVDEPSGILTQAIRLAMLDLFIQHTHSSRPYPNVSHLLLFGGAISEFQIQDPHALGARRSCVHSIIDLLNEGVPKLRSKGRARKHTVSANPLFATLPSFAERCYRVIFQLCQHPRTSESTMRYLRTREDFVTRHLAVIPFMAPSTDIGQDPFIEVLYNDGSRVNTTSNDFAAFMRLRSWILDMVALELHVLTSKGLNKSIAELLELLFGSEEDFLEGDQATSTNDALRPFREVGQSHIRIIEFLQSLDFDWSDSLQLQLQHVELQFLGKLNLLSCLRSDPSGCEVVDRNAVLSLLAVARRNLHHQGRITTSADAQQLNAETSYIVESCAVENHRRGVRFAASNGFDAWRRLLDMCLLKCFERLPHDRRETMLFDLLHAIPTVMRSPNVEESVSILLAEAMESTITKLRQDRYHQVILQSAGGDVEAGALPAERLYALLRSILDCIMDNNRQELVRGNLYASLIHYLRLVTSADATELAESDQPLSASLTGSISLNGSVLLPSGQPAARSKLMEGSLTTLRGFMDRLVSSVARDAVDGSDVWKTISFILLDSLAKLGRLEKQPAILKALARQGFLAGFVRGIKESDKRLQDTLAPDPSELNSLFVYEAKMALFIRMSQSRPGAERLLESRIISILADCDYLDARPEADQAFMDQDTFLPSATQRYHQLFLPALQLLNGMLMTLGHQHISAGNQTLHFISSHRDTLILLLKNEVDEFSLSVTEELRLLVCLCTDVVDQVPKTELLSNSGFGPIHAAISSLAARCLGNRHWSERITPQTADELENAGTTRPGFGNESQFRVDVHQKDRLLRRALIAYLGAASDSTEPDLTVVLSPSINNPRQEERSGRYIAVVPTLSDAIELLNLLCDDLTNSLKRIVDISAELTSQDYIRVDRIEDILPISNADLLDNLDMRQKQSLISRELGLWRVDSHRWTMTLLSSMEMMLLLLWRHLAYYCEGQHLETSEKHSSKLYAMRLTIPADVEALTAEAARKLLPVLERLRGLDLSEETLGKDWQSYRSYIEIMTRRMKDTIGVTEGPEVLAS
ncbi:uncharacterized protein LAESUDRAFT_702393 [Laetiporus sulphureus 93-53]|uniref:Nucleoporin n=1 Tax=Laetiporus sulphureus 93-53 TaxID=1314785 RepID=A0A165DMS5_9APHY|nr:uncharacterized protein LAESUDRAFT_702393 [Laetiporus sulphureus 93-53]KZT05221.1 hypothetical protein LAESUDRAFT_702393 [Laetiporus sulphureus 93-53]